ncbi:MAG: hypothetical protein M3Y87_13330 [Myxococcota bacterium]|nr:hypothetical protein [Myxococcota bacterium]
MTDLLLPELRPAQGTRDLAEILSRAADTVALVPPTREQAIAWILSLERFHEEPLASGLSTGIREALSPTVTAAAWREALPALDVVIAELRQSVSVVAGPVMTAAEAAIALVHADLATRAQGARAEAHRRVRTRLDVILHFRDRLLARVAQLEGRVDEDANERLRRRALGTLRKVDASAEPITDEEADALTREARRAG